MRDEKLGNENAHRELPVTNVSMLTKCIWCAILLTGILIILSSGVGIRPLDAFDDCFYAEASRNILKTGDWLNLYWLGGSPFLEKPPLQFWITAGLFKVMGVTEFSARLFPMFCGLGMVLVVMMFARRFLSWQASCVAGLAMLSFPAFYEYSTKAMLDIPVAFLISISLLFFHKGIEQEGQRRYFWFYGISFGLAVLTKSVVGFVPLIAGTMILLLKRPGRNVWRYYLESLAIAFLVIMPWHAYAYVRHGNLFLREYLLYHVVQRMMGDIGYQTGNSVWFYFLEIGRSNPLGIFIVLGIAVVLVRAIIYRDWNCMLLAGWIAAVFIPISASAVRLAWYTVPLYPPFALSVAVASDVLIKKVNRPVLVYLLVAGAALSALWTGYHFQHEKIELLSKETNPFQLKNLFAQFRKSSANRDLLRIYEFGEAAPLAYFYADRPIQFQFSSKESLAAHQKIPSNYLEKGVVRMIPDLKALEMEMEHEGGFYLFQKTVFSTLPNRSALCSEEYKSRDFILVRCSHSGPN